MEKLKKAIEGKERRKGLESYILMIDENKDSNPNIALDNAKSILEAISKTILKDKGIVYANDSKIKFLVKKAFESLPIFSKLETIDIERGKSIVASLENISQKIGEFRNDYGFFSHGNDLEAEKFDRYLVDLAISSSDLLSSFLIISHSEDLKDRSRIYYDENEEFNQWFDEKEERLLVKGVSYPPSKTLFHNDIEAYKEELLGFENDPDALISTLEESNNPEEVIDNIIDIKSILSLENFKELQDFVSKQTELRNQLVHAGAFDSIKKLQEAIKEPIDNIRKISEQLRLGREKIKEELKDEIIEENIDEIKEQVADDVIEEYIEDKRGEMQYEEMKDEGLL